MHGTAGLPKYKAYLAKDYNTGVNLEKYLGITLPVLDAVTSLYLERHTHFSTMYTEQSALALYAYLGKSSETCIISIFYCYLL